VECSTDCTVDRHSLGGLDVAVGTCRRRINRRHRSVGRITAATRQSGSRGIRIRVLVTVPRASYVGLPGRPAG
jgi:hypothetical protein